MDMGDQAVRTLGKQGVRRKDPLIGIDLTKEYASIAAGTSKLTERIQLMITARVEEGT
jgi:hypothetical protein